MQEGGGVKGFQFGSLYTHFFCYLNGVHANPLQVLVRGLVFGFDGKCQSLNRTQMEICHLLDVALFVLQLSQI